MVQGCIGEEANSLVGPTRTMSIVSLVSHLHFRMKPATREVVLAVLFLMVVLSVFYERMVWQQWVPFDGDMWTQYFPAKWYAFSYIKQGILPLWTPNLRRFRKE